jgi:hypothetical protein
MSFKFREIRDGTGPYKHSYRRLVEKKKIGRRLEKGFSCPFKKEINSKIKW